QAAYTASEQGNLDIWTADLTRGVRTRLTLGPEVNINPVWSPTGKEIAFASERNGNFDVFVQAANGVGEPRPGVMSPDAEYPDAWSPDGTTLLIRRVSPKTGYDLWTVKRKADGTLRPGTPVKLFRNPVFTADFQRPWDVHPDGKRFLLAEDDETEVKPTSIHVILNWPALVREKGPR